MYNLDEALFFLLFYMSFIALIFILEEQTQSRPSFILAHAGKSCGIMIIWLFLTSKAPLYV
jgi:hypothetical protein